MWGFFIACWFRAAVAGQGTFCLANSNYNKIKGFENAKQNQPGKDQVAQLVC